MRALIPSNQPVKTPGKSRSLLFALFYGTALLSSALVNSTAQAENFDFGGRSQRFKGGGDKTPPDCQIEVPRAATEAFFVKWNCSDLGSGSEQIRSELWLYRKGSTAGELVANFLGFPASVRIDEGLLKVENFSDALPFSVKLIARDRAGVSAISPMFTVYASDNSLSQCSLNISTQATESDGDNIGTPSLTVVLNNVKVSSTPGTDSQFSLNSKGIAQAQPCELDALCRNGHYLSFSSNLNSTAETGASTTEVSGSLTLSPLGTVIKINGSGKISGAELQSLTASGSATIDGQKAEITFECSR